MSTSFTELEDPEKLESLKVELTNDIDASARTFESRHGTNYWIHQILLVSGLACATSISILLALRMPTAAAVGGAIASLILGIDSAMALRDLAEFQRVVARKARNLISDLKFSVDCVGKFENVRKQFNALSELADQELPRGTGMQAVQNLYEKIDRVRNVG
jgi:hypothetical protein